MVKRRRLCGRRDAPSNAKRKAGIGHSAESWTTRRIAPRAEGASFGHARTMVSRSRANPSSSSIPPVFGADWSANGARFVNLLLLAALGA